MTNMPKSFEEFLANIHAEDYHGTDDDMPDNFETWLTGLGADDFLHYGELYADSIRESLKTK